MSKVRIICVFIFILIIIPFTSTIADVETLGIYGVTIQLKNNEKLEGYIETFSNHSVCSQKKKDNTTGALLLETSLKYQSERADDVTFIFINKIIEIKYNNAWSIVVANSSVQKIKTKDIKSIEFVCKNWDGYSAPPRITDYMAEYISNHKLVTVYEYDESGEDSYCHTTYLSYNPKYTREMLIKKRGVIDKMSNETLDKEKLIRFTECWC